MRGRPGFGRALWIASALCALLLLQGCARWPELIGDEAVATRSLGPGEREGLVSDAWSVSPGVYFIRLSGLYGYRGFDMALTGVVEADTIASRTRFVGLTDTGLTLFDVESEGEATEGEIKVNFLVEGLLTLPDFAATMGRSAQRILIAPFPGPDDVLELLDDRYLLHSKRIDGEVVHTLTGDGRLVAKRYLSDGEAWGWSVRYGEHGNVASSPLPALIDYSDDKTGATLRLRLTSVRLKR